MTPTGVLIRIEEAYESFSPSHKSLADFILNHVEEAAFLSAHELADRVGTSSSTVVRFARSLGYDGYPAFLVDLQSLLKWRVTPSVKLRTTLSSLSEGENLLCESLRADIQALEETLQSIDIEAFEKAVDVLAEADCIYLIGLGISAAVVYSLQFRLRRLQMRTMALTRGGRDLFEGLLSIKLNDVVLAVGFHRPHPEILTALDFARSREAAIIVLTDGPFSLLAQKADYVLNAKRGPVQTLTSLAVPMAVVNALAIGVARRRAKQAEEAYAWVEEMQTALGINGSEPGSSTPSPKPSP